MKKNTLVCIFVFTVFFTFNGFCYSSTSLRSSDSIIKTMFLVEDTKRALLEGDPYAVQEIFQEITKHLRYIDFGCITNDQLKVLIDLITKNITSSKEYIQSSVLDLVNVFIQELQANMNDILKNKALHSTLRSFSQELITMLSTLSSKHPSLIIKLLGILQNINFRLS